MPFTPDDVGPRMVGGVAVELTAAERAAVVAEWNAAEARQPLEEWERQMAAAEQGMPQALEDVIDALDVPTRARIAPETMALHAAKQTLRGNRPT